MSLESPLFHSSIELFCHAIEHVNSGNELDRKLVILHLANSVELILKDLVLDNGLSIYKTPKETITVLGAISKIKNELSLELQHLNKIELLIDERNGLQHRFGYPNEVSTFYYMNETFEFMACLLNDFYGEDFGDILEQFCDKSILDEYIDSKKGEDTDISQIMKVARINPVSALLMADLKVEELVRNFMIDNSLSSGTNMPRYNIRILSKQIDIPNEIIDVLIQLNRAKNRVSHGKMDYDGDDLSSTVEAIKKFRNYLSSYEFNKDLSNEIE